MIRKILIVVLLLVIIGASTGYYLWNKKAARAEDIKSIPLTAVDFSKEYTANEKNADAKYLNKNIAVSGVVSEVDNNQDGGVMLVLQTGDPSTGIQCSMRDKGITAVKGQYVTIKGFCSGNGITGVTLTQCVISK